MASAAEAHDSICGKFGLKPLNKQNLLFYYAPVQGALSYTALSVNVMNPSLMLRYSFIFYGGISTADVATFNCSTREVTFWLQNYHFSFVVSGFVPNAMLRMFCCLIRYLVLACMYTVPNICNPFPRKRDFCIGKCIKLYVLTL